MPSLLHPSTLFAFFATAVAHCLFILSLMSTGTPRCLSTELLHNWVDPSLCYTFGLCFPGCETLHLLNLTRLLLAPFSGVFRSSCRVVLPSKMPTSPLSLTSSANSVRVHLIPLSRSLMKILNSVGPNFSPWGTPPLTGCQFEWKLFATTLRALPVSHVPTPQTTYLDSNTSVSPGEVSGKQYQKPGRRYSRQCPPVALLN